MAEQKKYLDYAGLSKAFSLIAGKYATKEALNDLIAKLGDWTDEDWETLAKAVKTNQTNIETIETNLTNYLLKTDATVDEDAQTVTIQDKSLDIKQLIENAKTAVKSEIINGADSQWDTLKEIGDWINTHKGEYDNLVELLDSYVKKADVDITDSTKGDDFKKVTLDGKSQDFLIKHQDITGKVDRSELDAYVKHTELDDEVGEAGYIKEDALEDIKSNIETIKGDIETLNGEETVSGSVKKTVKDAIVNLDLENTYVLSANALTDGEITAAFNSATA